MYPSGRSVKRETLKLIETFVDKADDAELIAKNFVPAMTDPILGDYARNVSDARESEVLSLFATIINKFKSAMMDDVPRISEAVFACTLDMITKNFEDYPEHRLKFFSLLRAIASRCFRDLFTLSGQQLKLVMDSIIWAFRHTERNVAETGLNLYFAVPSQTIQQLLAVGAGAGESPFTICSLAIHSSSFLFLFILAYSIATPGGIFMPSIMVGASFGACLGRIFELFFPRWPIQPGMYALVGAIGAFSFGFVSFVPVKKSKSTFFTHVQHPLHF